MGGGPCALCRLEGLQPQRGLRADKAIGFRADHTERIGEEQDRLVGPVEVTGLRADVFPDRAEHEFADQRSDDGG